MAFRKDMLCCGNIRIICLIIGYMNLIAAVVDIVLHFFIVAVASRGFECEVDNASLQFINWPWLVPVMFIINLGTHGFYPFPFMLRSFDNDRSFDKERDYLSIIQPKCFPGMVHIDQVDVLNFMINAIWLKFVISYVKAVHRKETEPMRLFFGLSVVKLVLQVMYFAYQPDIELELYVDTHWFIKLLDICIASVFLLFINKYIKELRNEKTQPIVDQPPTYIECLMTGTQNKQEEKNTVSLQPVEQKIDLASNVATEARV